MAGLAEAEDLGVGEEREAEVRRDEALSERDAEERERARGRLVGEVLTRRDRDVALAEEVGETVGLRRRDDAAPVGRMRDLAEEDVEPARVGGRAPPGDAERLALSDRKSVV